VIAVINSLILAYTHFSGTSILSIFLSLFVFTFSFYLSPSLSLSSSFSIFFSLSLLLLSFFLSLSLSLSPLYLFLFSLVYQCKALVNVSVPLFVCHILYFVFISFLPWIRTGSRHYHCASPFNKKLVRFY